MTTFRTSAPFPTLTAAYDGYDKFATLTDGVSLIEVEHPQSLGDSVQKIQKAMLSGRLLTDMKVQDGYKITTVAQDLHIAPAATKDAYFDSGTVHLTTGNLVLDSGSSTIKLQGIVIDPAGVQDGQTLVYDATQTKLVPGASGDASFKLQSIATPNAVLKGGHLLVDNGKELATYDGTGSLSTDFGKDLTINLTTVLGSAPADATSYYLYIDLASLSAAVTETDIGRKVYAVVEANFKLLTAAPDVTDLARYVPRAVIRSATTGTAWSGTGSMFATLAFLAGQTVDNSKIRPQITQTAHGFVAADLGSPLYLTAGGVYTKAKADAANTAEVIGLLLSIESVNAITLSLFGDVTVNTAVSGGALVVGSNYYVSAATAGLITATEPSVIGEVSKPIGVAKSTTVLEFINMRGVVVGGTNALTSIAIANNATSTIQNVASYQAGELSGYVAIIATSSVKFFIKAQFSKNAAGTDYNLSYQTSGETPPVGWSMTVTTAGLIQIVMPSAAGFTSSTITYGLNVAAVGATFPLSISARNVIGDVSGTAVPAGYVGQVITWAVAPIDQLATSTLTDWTNANLSLTTGSWIIYAGIQAFLIGQSVGGGNNLNVSLTTTTNTVVQSIYPLTTATIGSSFGGYGTIVAPINVTVATVYKLRFNVLTTNNGGSGTISNSDGRSYLYAVRIA